MPNYCNCVLVVRSSDKEQLSKFQRENVSTENPDEPLSFAASVPVPDALKNDDWQRSKEIADKNEELYGYSGWYDFRVAKWGTKWEPIDPRIIIKEDRVEYVFDTAWDPPTPWVQKVSELYPSLNFTLEFHEEAGMYPSEIVTFENGDMISQEYVKNENITENEDEGDEENISE